MASVDVSGWLLLAAVLALFGWYFVHVALRLRDGVRAVGTLPAALERAFDGSVPPWLRLVRVIMLFVICLAVAALLVRKFEISF